MTPLRRALRWVPLALLATSLGALWATVLLAGGMAAVGAWFALQLVTVALGLVTLLVVLVWALVRRRFSAPMVAASLASLVALWPVAWGFGFLRIPFPGSLETAGPTATVRLPAREPLRVLWGGDRLASNYHAFAPDQRWAYDLGVDPVLVESSRLEDYGCYGVEVLAPADGAVVKIVDGEPDEEPGKLSENYGNPAGNQVWLRLSTGTYLLLAHLQKGSVAVTQGASVPEGQLLGRCGNSGNTSEPHIHLHHQRQDPNEAPFGFAEGLPLFFREHDGPPMPEGGVELRDGRPVSLGATVRPKLP